MSERRREVLEALHQAGAPLGVIEIADRVGIHPNTARFHLDALAAEGAIEQVPGTPTGPGRPRIGYRARPGRARGGARQYRTLAEILLAHLAATSDQPAAAAATAGRAWGANLVAGSRSRDTLTGAEAVARLTGLLDALDFAPEPVSSGSRPTDRIRLRHCPFLELADPHRD
ncbi:MAG: helix-turn-helix transcriptional regulator, partial [Pseudonocardia sp.]